jgi:hypothetical protein
MERKLNHRKQLVKFFNFNGDTQQIVTDEINELINAYDVINIQFAKNPYGSHVMVYYFGN